MHLVFSEFSHTEIRIPRPLKKLFTLFNWKNYLIFQVFQYRCEPCNCSTPQNSVESSRSFRHMALPRMVHSFSEKQNTIDNTTKKDIFYQKQFAHFNKRFCEKLEARNLNVIIQYVLYFKHFKKCPQGNETTSHELQRFLFLDSTYFQRSLHKKEHQPLKMGTINYLKNLKKDRLATFESESW